MRKIQEIFNFDNIGGKIKTFAKWSCWISIFLIWVTAPIAFVFLAFDKWAAHLCWIPLVAAIVCPISIWIGSWTMYAFGEYVEDIHTIRDQTSKNNIYKIFPPIPKPSRDKSTETGTNESQSPEPSSQNANTPLVKAENSFSETYWVCGKCKTKNLNTRINCWSCGNAK